LAKTSRGLPGIRHETAVPRHEAKGNVSTFADQPSLNPGVEDGLYSEQDYAKR